MRYDLSGWVETKLLCTFSSQAIADYLWVDVICCYNCFGKLVIDSGLKNKDVLAELAENMV